MLQVLITDKSFKERALNIRLEHTAVRDIAFIHTGSGSGGGSSSYSTSSSGPPTLAVLFSDDSGSGRVLLQCYELDVKERVSATSWCEARHR